MRELDLEAHCYIISTSIVICTFVAIWTKVQMTMLVLLAFLTQEDAGKATARPCFGVEK